MVFSCAQQQTPAITFFQWIINPQTAIVSSGSGNDFTFRTTTMNVKFNTMKESGGRGFAPYVLARVTPGGADFCVTCKVTLSLTGKPVLSGIAVLDGQFNNIFETSFGSDTANAPYNTYPEPKSKVPLNGNIGTSSYLGLKYTSSTLMFHNGESDFTLPSSSQLQPMYIVLFMRGECDVGGFESQISDLVYTGLTSVTALPNFYPSGVSSPSLQNYVKTQNVMTDAESIIEGTASLVNCEALCETTTGCTGFEHVDTTQSCTLKKVVFAPSSPVYSGTMSRIISATEKPIIFDVDQSEKFIALRSNSSQAILKVLNSQSGAEVFTTTLPENIRNIKFNYRRDIYVTTQNGIYVYPISLDDEETYSSSSPRSPILTTSPPSKITFFGDDESTIVVTYAQGSIGLYGKIRTDINLADSTRIESIVTTETSILALQLIPRLNSPVVTRRVTVLKYNQATNSFSTVSPNGINDSVIYPSGGIPDEYYGSLNFNKNTKRLSVFYNYKIRGVVPGTSSTLSGKTINKFDISLYTEQSDGSFLRDTRMNTDTYSIKRTKIIQTQVASVQIISQPVIQAEDIRGIIVFGNFIYVCDYGKHVIWKINKTTGRSQVLAGSPGNSGYADGTGGSARFQNPIGMVINSTGTTLYVTEDKVTQNIRMIDTNTGTVTSHMLDLTTPIRASSITIGYNNMFHVATPDSIQSFDMLTSNRKVVKICDATNPTHVLYKNGKGFFLEPTALKQVNADLTTTTLMTGTNMKGLAISIDGETLYTTDNGVLKEIDIATKIVTPIDTVYTIQPTNIYIEEGSSYIWLNNGSALGIETLGLTYSRSESSIVKNSNQIPIKLSKGVIGPVSTTFDSFGGYFAVANNTSIQLFRTQGDGKFMNNSFDDVTIDSNVNQTKEIVFRRNLFLSDNQGLKIFMKQASQEPSRFSSPNPSLNSSLYMKYDTTFFDQLNIRIDTPIKDLIKSKFNLRTLIIESSNFLAISDKNVIISRDYSYHIMTYPRGSSTSVIAFKFSMSPIDNFYILTKNLDFNQELILMNDQFEIVKTIPTGVSDIKIINPGPTINITNSETTEVWKKSKIFEKIVGIGYTTDHIMFKGNRVEYYENNTKIRDRQVTMTHANFKIIVKDTVSGNLLAIFFVISSDTIVLSYYNLNDDIFGIRPVSAPADWRFKPTPFHKNTDVELLYLVDERPENLGSFPYLRLDENIIKAFESVKTSDRDPFPVSEEFIIYGRTFVYGSYSIEFIDDRQVVWTTNLNQQFRFNYYNYNGYIIYVDQYGTTNILCTDKTNYTKVYRFYYPLFEMGGSMVRMDFTLSDPTKVVKTRYNHLDGSWLEIDLENSVIERRTLSFTSPFWRTLETHRVTLDRFENLMFLGKSIVLISNLGSEFRYFIGNIIIRDSTEVFT